MPRRCAGIIDSIIAEIDAARTGFEFPERFNLSFRRAWS
jgi:hypothetical protein